MESVDWENMEIVDWLGYGSEKIYKMHAAGMSMREIANTLKISYSSTRTMLVRGKVGQYHRLRTAGVPFKQALAALKLPDLQAYKLELQELKYPNGIDDSQPPTFYSMALLAKHKQAIESLLENMNERAGGLRNAVHDGGESHEGTAQRDAGEGLRQGA